MSRVVRNEVGLNITCRHHPNEILFWPRMSLDDSRSMRDAGPSENAGVDDRKYSRSCTRDACRICARACRVHPEYRAEQVQAVLEALAQMGTTRVWTVTDHEMDHMIRHPARADAYLSARSTPPSA